MLIETGGVTDDSEVDICGDGIGSGCCVGGVTLGCSVSGCTGGVSIGVGASGVTAVRAVVTDTSFDHAPVTQSVAEAITK